MRNVVLIIMAILVVMLSVCVYKARRTDKAIGLPLSMLISSLIPAIAGSIIVIGAADPVFAQFGCYIYYVSMDVMLAALLYFSLEYCSIKKTNRTPAQMVYLLLTIDAVQIMLDPFFHHALAMREVSDEGFMCYDAVPLTGLLVHRIIAYSVFTVVMVIFAVKIKRMPRLYTERYAVILAVMFITGAWELSYMFSGRPMDTSVIGLGVLGLLVFYFSLYYKSALLLDRLTTSIVSEIDEAIVFFDNEKKCIWKNEAATSLLGVKDNNTEEIVKRLVELFPDAPIDDPEWRIERKIGRKEHAKYYVVEKHTAVDPKGRVEGTFARIRDITEDQKILNEERYAAHHDKLTGLYNRDYMTERIRETIDANPDTLFQVAYVDVKEFKIVNDIFGKEFGDFAIKKIAEWVAADNPKDWVYGRLEGDTFAVFQPVDSFRPIRINKALNDFTVRQGNIEHHIVMHVGIYVITEPDLEVSVMFDRAQMAISLIKSDYSNHIAYYDDSMRTELLWKQKISSEMHTAIGERQIRPYIQPIVDMEGRIVGGEALVRWMHPENGFLSPEAFVPVFEDNGMIAEIDRYMWRCSAEILKLWETDHPNLFLSVNISPKDFYYMDVRAEINSIVKKYKIRPEKLRLEITESVMMTELESKIAILNGLKEDGFIIEMDDFGSGYSSLNLLKDMPVDLIKIDMAFLKVSKPDNKASAILEKVIELTKKLGIVSLTEGVETEQQFSSLAKMGCELFQGYFFSKPLTTEAFEKYCNEPDEERMRLIKDGLADA